jgi:hypothetical protein
VTGAAALLAPTGRREEKHRAGRGDRIAHRGEGWGGRHVPTTPPSPNARIATAPAPAPLRYKTDPGHGSAEHRSAWTPSDPRPMASTRCTQAPVSHGLATLAGPSAAIESARPSAYLAFITGPNNASVLSSREGGRQDDARGRGAVMDSIFARARGACGAGWTESGIIRRASRAGVRPAGPHPGIMPRHGLDARRQASGGLTRPADTPLTLKARQRRRAGELGRAPA